MHFTLITFFINSAERSRVLNRYVDIAIMLVRSVFTVCWYSLNIGLSQQKFCVETVQFNQYQVSEEKSPGKKPEEDKAGSPPSPLPSI